MPYRALVEHRGEEFEQRIAERCAMLVVRFEGIP
jgi:hypothetical protein